MPPCRDNTRISAALLKQGLRTLQRTLSASIAIKAGLILGSGWGPAAQALGVRPLLSYHRVPALGATGVDGHAGRIGLASFDWGELLVFQGRCHWYEGRGWNPIAFPVYACHACGARTLVLTNAAGSLRPAVRPGSLFLLADHINAMGVNPLMGRLPSPWDTRFPDQTMVYDLTLREHFARIARRLRMTLRQGTYVAMTGPAYETPAEVRMLQEWGASTVGMSTVPEAMLANAAGMRVAGLSCVTNLAGGLGTGPLSHKEVGETAARTMKDAARLLALSFKTLPVRQS